MSHDSCSPIILVMLCKVFWLSIKGIARKPLVFVFLFVFSFLFYFAPGVPNISISLDVYRPISDSYDEPRPLASFGEWGRLALLFCSSGGAGIFALFISLLFLAAFWPEIVHKEPLWTTPKAGVSLLIAKLFSVGAVGTSVVTMASLCSLLRYVPHGIFVIDGGSYVPIYLLLSLVQSLWWASFSFFLFSLSNSRVVVVFVATAIAIVWSAIFEWIPSGQKIAPLLTLLYRSYISWNFVGPYAPFGLIPLVLTLQILTLTFATIAVLSGGLLIWYRRTKWQGIIKAHKGLLVLILGILFAFGAGIFGVREINHHRAPMQARDLHILRLERHYIWSKDGMLVFFPGRYAMVKLPLEELMPRLQDATDKRIVQIYFGKAFPLTLILPPDNDYPSEIAGVIKHLKRQLQPVLTRAATWKKASRIVVAPPGFSFPFADIQDGILISCDVLGSFFQFFGYHYNMEDLFWILTESSGLKECERAYLWIYLIAGFDAQKTQFYLISLTAKARGERVHLRYFLEKADCILNHWQRGEEMGHENYIQMLLQGGGDDQSGSSD